MATWTTIPDSSLEPGKPIRAIDALALRDNPVAIAEGATGAVKIADDALGLTATTAGTNWVNARNAGSSAGAIGTYAFAGRVVSGDAAFGATVAGSSLVPTGALRSIGDPGSFSLNTGGVLTGTWRCMGTYDHATPTFSGSIAWLGATLWLRIA